MVHGFGAVYNFQSLCSLCNQLLSSCSLMLKLFGAGPEPWKLMKKSAFQLVKFCLWQGRQAVPSFECNVSIFHRQRRLPWQTSQPEWLSCILSSVPCTSAKHQVSFLIVFCQSQRKPVKISGSLLQLVTAVAHPMMGSQRQLEEDPEQVVTASLILEIVQRTECPEAGLAGMGILVAPRVVLRMACVQWQGYHLFVGHTLECGL